MSDATPPASTSPTSASPPARAAGPRRTLPPFSAARLHRRLALDAAVRFAAVAAAVVASAVLLWLGGPAGTVLAVALVIGVLFGLNASAASALRMLPMLGPMTLVDPDAAEAALAAALRRRPLPGWVRLALVGRWAALRHRQRRFDESADAAQAVVAKLRRPLLPMRPQLLLLIAEARLETGHVDAAHAALAEVIQLPRDLQENLQHLALQTRYELAAGHAAWAVQHAGNRIAWAELMPAPLSATVHAMLATAADRTQHSRLASWLWARVELLAPPDAVAPLREGRWTGEPVVVPTLDLESGSPEVPQSGITDA